MTRRTVFLFLVLLIVVLGPIGCSRIYTLFVVNYSDHPVTAIIDGIPVGGQLKEHSCTAVPRFYITSVVEVKVLSSDHKIIQKYTIDRSKVLKDTMRDQVIVIEIK